jgi:hypothetical protein
MRGRTGSAAATAVAPDILELTKGATATTRFRAIHSLAPVTNDARAGPIRLIIEASCRVPAAIMEAPPMYDVELLIATLPDSEP